MINMAARWLLVAFAAVLLWQLISSNDVNVRLVCALLLVLVGQLREFFLMRAASEYHAHAQQEKSRPKKSGRGK
ncbi:hypothetical protein J4441_05745 [Candidatus Micrarchaeota archaeon]|nr:hypothetical protein [Candidatus Micrarchaeota archaeon]